MNLVKTLTGLMTRLEKANKQIVLAINRLAKAIEDLRQESK